MLMCYTSNGYDKHPEIKALSGEKHCGKGKQDNTAQIEPHIASTHFHRHHSMALAT